MLVDKFLEFSDAQAVTAAAASTNVVDLKAARDMGAGDRKLFIVAQLDETMDDTGDDSTLAVALQTDSDEAFGTVVTLVTMFTFAAVAVAGTRKIYEIPPGLAFDRYIRLYYTPANGNLSAGQVTAWLTDNIEQLKNYPSQA